MRIKFSLLLIFGVFLCGRNVNAALNACSTQDDCDPATNPQDGYCDTSYATDSCRCNHLYDQNGNDHTATCDLKACSTPSSDCGTNTACTTGGKCACLITHIPTVATGATATTCTRKQPSCSASTSCTGSSTGQANIANSYCLNTGSDTGCHCTATHSVSDTACAAITCTQADIVSTTCGSSNTVCGLTQSSRQCECAANYEASGSSCTQKACTTANVDTNCGSTHVCTNDKCECSSDYVASGTMCKRNCSANANVCHANADCIDGICECRVNYQGNGATCTAVECSSNNAAECHPNSQCSGTTCSCASGWTVNGTVCAKTCTGNSDCGSGETAGSCNTTAGVCQCTATYVGDGVVCNQKECTANSDCTVIAHSTCNTTSNLCICTDGVDSNDPLLCSGASTVVYNFSFMLLSLLMATFFKKF